MNLTISSTNLLKALMDVSKAIPSKSPLPILENFLFVLKDGRLEITASDSELTLRTAIEVDGPQEEGGGRFHRRSGPPHDGPPERTAGPAGGHQDHL